MANIDWRDLVYQPNVGQAPNVQIPYRYQAPNVPESQPVTVNPTSSQIEAAPSTSGLYTLYNQRNPYSARASRLASMAGKDMGGKLGQLPGIVATYLAGKAEKEAEDFEATRQSKIDAVVQRMEAWDKIKNDERAQAEDVKWFEKEVGPKMFQKFSEKYKELGGDSKDPETRTKAYNEAGKFAAQYANEEVSKAKKAVPVIENWSPFSNGEIAMIWRKSDNSVVQGRMDKEGNLGVMNEEGKVVPSDSGDMLFDTYAKLQDVRSRAKEAEARQVKASAPTTSRDPILQVLGSQLNSFRNMRAQGVQLTPEQEAQESAIEAEMNQRAGVNRSPVTSWEPGTNPPSGAFKRAQSAVQPQSSGGLSGFVSRIVGGSGQAQPPASQPAPQHQAQTEAQQAAAWIAANPNAPASQVAAIKAKYRLP